MSWRRQLPVLSPLDWRAVLASTAAAPSTRVELARILMAELGAPGLLLTDSGTTALAMAMRTVARLRPALPVALPAYGCFDLVTAALGAGVTIVLYDIEPTTLLPDADSLRSLLRQGVGGVVLVHHYGLPVPVAPIRSLAEGTGALIIEDAAQAIGGLWGGRPLGAQGDLGVLSFGRGKGWTGGGGGALVLGAATQALEPSLRAALAEAAGGEARFAVKLAAQWLLGRPRLYSIPAAVPALRLGETIFRAPEPARDMRPASAAVLLRTRLLANAESVTRRANAARLIAHLMRRGLRAPAPAHTDAVAGWLRLPLLGRYPDADLAGAARLGIMPGYPVSLDALPESQPILRSRHRLPGARMLAAQLWTLPTHGRLSSADLDAIERWTARELRA